MKNLRKKYVTNTIAKLFATVILIAGFALASFAAPPANDDYNDAQVVTGGQAIGSNVQSTHETNEPIHALNRGGSSVWYRYTATGDGALTINTTGSNFDTLLAVYSGNFLNSLTIVAANDDISTPANLQSQVVVGVHSGTIYYITVDGFNGAGTSASGNVTLNFSLSNVVPNDNFANAAMLSGAKGRVITTNVGASKEAGEPNHFFGNQGGKSVWFKWTAPAGISKSYTFSTETEEVTSSSGINGSLAIYTGASVASLSSVANKHLLNDTRVGKLIFNPTPGTTYYIALDGFDRGPNNGGAETGTFTLIYDITKGDKTPDFDRDGKADITVFRPTTGVWYSLDSITGNLRSFQWGINGDKPLFADFNDNGVINYSVYRPSIGTWYVKDDHFAFGFLSFQWGNNTDIPLMLKDYSLDNHQQVQTFTSSTIFRPTTGTWWVNIGGSGLVIPFGQFGDVPVTADFNGDGNDELAVFRPSNGTWYIYDRKTGQYQVIPWGLNGDKPVVADYDADGKADVAVYRPSNGNWYVMRSSDGQIQYAAFGVSTDIPQPADYDGDGKADYAVFRPSNGVWYMQQSSLGYKAAAFGLGIDIPVTTPIAAQ